MGFTGSGRAGVLAHRAAPVQVNYSAIPRRWHCRASITSLPTRLSSPSRDRACYTESVVYLPECYQPGDSRRGLPDTTPTREQCGLAASGFVFCCFNNHYRSAGSLRHLDAVACCDGWQRAVARGGLGCHCPQSPEEAANAASLPSGSYLRRDCRAPRSSGALPVGDLFLDTLPFNAHATANDALWMGLAVSDQQGNTFAPPRRSSLLTAIGLPELITASAQDYEALALQLATTPACCCRCAPGWLAIAAAAHCSTPSAIAATSRSPTHHVAQNTARRARNTSPSRCCRA